MAHDASADGSTVVGYGTSEISIEAFVWTSDGGMESIGGGKALDVTPDGSTVVGYGGGSFGIEAFRWTSTEQEMEFLGAIPEGPLANSAVAHSHTEE